MLLFCKIVVIFLLLVSVQTYKILCLFPYPGKSHFMMFSPILDELIDRGHNLTIVSFFPATDMLQDRRREVSLVGLAPINVEVIDLSTTQYYFMGLEKYFQHIPIVTELAKFHLSLCEKILDSEVFREFIEVKGDYDLILVEHFISDCMYGIIYKYGIPSVGLISSTMLPWTMERVGAPNNPSYVPGMTLYVTDEMSLGKRIENTFFLYFYKIWYKLAIRREEQKLLERKLGSLPALEELAKETKVVLVNTHYSINGVKATPPSVVEVGGIHLYNRSVRQLPNELKQWIAEANNGFILFSFGSLIRSSSLPREQIQIFIKVFSKLSLRVIWKWEDNSLENIPKNVLLTKWAPQYDLLNHPKCAAFITHGGLLSMTEAVDAGVPMLMLPILGDQFGNAAHAEYAGVAVSLQLQNIDEASLLNGLKNVLSPQMKIRAMKLRAEWRDRPTSPMNTAIYWIERTARHNTSDLSSKSRHLPFHQVLLLDVITFYCTVLILTIYIIYKAFRLILKSILKKIKVKQN